MRFVLPWVLLLGLPAPLMAEEETVKIGLDCGYWSSTLTGNAFLVTKVLFVRGAYEGATALHVDLFDAAERAKSKPKSAPSPANPQQVAELFEKRYLRQTSYMTLVSGLDAFCSDPQNQQVWLTGAIKVVSMQVRGESSEAINAEVLRLRAEPGP